jgi:hypothetical protein
MRLALSSDEFAELVEELESVPQGKMVEHIAKYAESRGIKICKRSLYWFRDRDVVPWMQERLRRKQMMECQSMLGMDSDGAMLADVAAANLAGLLSDSVEKLTAINPANPLHMESVGALSIAIARLRTGDRALQKQVLEMKERERKAKEISEDKTLTDIERAAKMRALFGA